MSSKSGNRSEFGSDIADVAQPQPLSREIFNQGAGLGIRQHSPDFPFQNLRALQASMACRFKKTIVRDAAPEKKRQPRRQFHVADAVGSSCHRIVFDAKDELRTCKNPL